MYGGQRIDCNTYIRIYHRILQRIFEELPSMRCFRWVLLVVPVGFTGQLDRILRQCLWRDKDTPKPSLAAWEMVCKPKNLEDWGW
jgi:hypothetical protein